MKKFQSKFCLINVQKPIKAFGPQQDSALYPDAGFTLRPRLAPPLLFFLSAAPANVQTPSVPFAADLSSAFRFVLYDKWYDEFTTIRTDGV